MPTDQEQIREIIKNWANATQDGRKDDVLTNHAPNALIFDPLPPLKYDDAASYRKSFDKWWPDTVDGKGLFEVNDLTVVSGDDVAFAHALVRCGGVAPDGSAFEDVVRVTHCLQKRVGEWKIIHSHTSMPIDVSEGAR